LILVAGPATAKAPVPPPRPEPKEPPKPQTAAEDAVAEAVQALHTSEPRLSRGNGTAAPAGDYPPPKCVLPDDTYEPCEDAIDLLVRAKRPVEKEMLELARSGAPLRVRCRAVRVLAQRGDAAVPCLEKMCASEDVDERYLAWWTYQDAVRSGWLKPPTDFAPLLALYASEKDEEVKNQIRRFFEATTARLLKPLNDFADSCMALWPVGAIRNEVAVHDLIEDYKKYDSNRHLMLLALGKIGTPQAVDFLIEHLDEYCAPEALIETRSEKALPALKKHLEKLEKSDAKDKHIDLAQTRIAVVRLSEKDPRESLMALAETRETKTRRSVSKRSARCNGWTPRSSTTASSGSTPTTRTWP
jgi:HEAT repeat protein